MNDPGVEVVVAHELLDPERELVGDQQQAGRGELRQQLESLTRHSDDRTLPPGLARWLLSARRNGRWGNTQENAMAM